MSSDKVLLQNLRDFTVQIRHGTKDTIVGTGIVISTDGKILTCAHVVVAAGVNPQVGRNIPSTWAMIVESIFGRKVEILSDAGDGEVEVYFPARPGRAGEARRARVLAYFSEYEDDVVILQLVGGPVPLGLAQIARLGTAELSEGNPFRSYGYSPTGSQPATRADGDISGTLERLPESHLQVDLVQLRSRAIDGGMSGAAVLDTVRNLVVGLIVGRYYPDTSPVKDEIGYAIDNFVLTFDPLNFSMQVATHPLQTVPQPRTDIDAKLGAAVLQPESPLNTPPPPLPDEEWVGRTELQILLDADWADPRCCITELIGFGGEGKSSLARHWLNTLLANSSQLQPNGVFWWNFYDKPTADAFFEAALAYLSGNRIDPRKYSSTFARVHFLAGMLTEGRYLFILDGLEVLQYQEGDQYGLLRSADLREFLSYFAAPRHQSFCLITSRAPVLDLIHYTTFTHHNVDRLIPEDGRALLCKIGLKGPDEAIDQMVADWDGHALTLSLLGSYLMEQQEGNVTHPSDIPQPTANESRFARVQRILGRYNVRLTETERIFLALFSAFRLPVTDTALVSVFRILIQMIVLKKEQSPLGRFPPRTQAVPTEQANILNASTAALSATAFNTLLKHLVAYRILRYNPKARHYTVHPLIHAYYTGRFSEYNLTQIQAVVHEHIKDYYLSLAGDIPPAPTLNDLVPLLEAVHHACCAGVYEEAFNIFWIRIERSKHSVLLQQLGAYETGLALMLEFFPNSNINQEPLTKSLSFKKAILNLVGFCLMQLGRQSEAVSFFERSIKMALSMQDWLNACINYQNLADLHADLGALAVSGDAAHQAQLLARRAQNKKHEISSLACQAWAAHLLGNLKTSSTLFRRAEALMHEIHPLTRYLDGLPGLKHADHLQQMGKVNYARQIMKANLKFACNSSKWRNDESFCHRVLGDLDAKVGESQKAQRHYDEALKIARGGARWVLIEALLAQGQWATRNRKRETAHRYLDEALSYAVAGGYRIYEVDISITLARAYLAAGDAASARVWAESAQRLSVEMDYYWGKVDAAEVLAALDGVSP